MKQLVYILFGFQKLNRLRVRLVIDNGILLDVMYQYEAYLQGEWLAIVRYDCAHGFSIEILCCQMEIKRRKRLKWII
jgi:hypothetical protein